MAEGNFGEQGTDHMQSMNHMVDTHNIDNMEGIIDVHDMGSLQGFDDMNNADKLNIADALQGISGSLDFDSLPDIENVLNAENGHDINNNPDLDNVHADNNLQDADNVTDYSHLSKELQGSQNDGGNSEEKKWPGWPGENVFRMLVPAQKVGGIIGRKGEFIKKLCEETKARIKILDGPPGTTERTVMISAKEEPGLSISPAMDGLLRVHNRVAEIDSESANAPAGNGRTVCTRLLVAATQAGSLIGKQGSTIKSIQDTSQCTIRVLGDEHLPVFALPDDSVVEVQGESAGVHKAVEMIATHLRKFLVDRGVISVFEMQMKMPNPRPNQNMPPPGPGPSWGPPHSGFPGGGPGFGPGNQYMPPPRPYDNYYPQGDMAPLDKQPRQSVPGYDRDAPIGGHATNMQPQQSMIAKVTQNMQIPLSYADAVIGASGSNISYIRRTSGATIAIQETRGVPGEMTVEINGTASQVQTAQQLIQNFVADVTSSMQNSTGGAPTQGYNNTYPSHGGAVYNSPPTNAPGGHTGHVPGSDYASVYGANYGY
ncbi:unnamed protein product [Cuscuta europaea]|uniref:K Homology domain-containing protein n=1 Tax=Cuscuta europaea TaxID=41803 RepID=A0A9P0YSQ5_CUSEU|nr:unnamed protein product [Cuscuta europaea]